MKSLPDVQNEYALLQNILQWFDDVAADAPPPHRTHANRVVVDDDLLDDLDRLLHWNGCTRTLTQPELGTLRGFLEQLERFCGTPPTPTDWRSFADSVRAVRSGGSWAHGLTAEEYELVHYWADAPSGT